MSSTLSDLIENYGYSSMPSKGVNQSDIPIPGDVEAEFQYNYFVKDETTTRDVSIRGDSITAFTTLSDDASEAERLVALAQFDVPRLVNIRWTPAVLESIITDEGSETSSSIGVTIGDNLSNVLYEEVMTSNQYSGIGLQDAEGLGMLTDMAKICVNASSLPIEFVTSDSSSEATESNLDVVNQWFDALSSGLDSSMLGYGGDTHGGNRTLDGSTKELLRNALASYQSEGTYSFANRTAEREAAINDTLSNNPTTFDIGISISNVLADVLGDKWSSDGGSAYFEEFNSIKDVLSMIATAAITQETAGQISDNDYDISGTPVTYRVVQSIADQTSDSQYVAQVTGYIIEKQEIDENGNILQMDPLVCEGGDIGSFVDPNIMYGRGYRYRVRTVTYLEFSAINTYPGNESRNETVVVGMFVASKASKAVSVICIETTPPKPPADIEFNYDGFNGSLDISWSFPLNRQRDIKQFRVFRRASIDDPFELIKCYFFNDADTVPKTPEISDPDSLLSSTSARLSGALIQVTDSAVALCRDSDFNEDSRYIYALTSVDARGMSSNYSSQYELSYDKFKSRIVLDYVSQSGAPMPYPNLYLKREVFIDALKTSGYNNMTVLFRPETLVVTDSSGTSLDYLSNSDDMPSYKISMINLDNQKSKMIDIYVRDIRGASSEIEEGVEYETTTRVATLIDSS